MFFIRWPHHRRLDLQMEDRYCECWKEKPRPIWHEEGAAKLKERDLH